MQADRSISGHTRIRSKLSEGRSTSRALFLPSPLPPGILADGTGLGRTGCIMLCWTGARRRKGGQSRNGTFARNALRCSGCGTRPGTSSAHTSTPLEIAVSGFLICIGQSCCTLSHLRSMNQSLKCQKRRWVLIGIRPVNDSDARLLSVCLDSDHDGIGTGVGAPARRQEDHL